MFTECSERNGKDEVRRLFEEHLVNFLKAYLEDKVSDSTRKILMSKWVGAAWSKVGKMKFLVSKKCGLSMAFHESEVHELDIESIPNYEMPKPFADENVRLGDDDHNNNESKCEENKNNVGSDNDELGFIYDEKL